MLPWIAHILQSLILFKIPILASFHALKSKDENESKRWILHWILTVIVLTVVAPVLGYLEFIFGETIVAALRIAVSASVLFSEKLVGN
mmetsp:Transcript_20183/g.2711  ORF Transcript_20183/g.2711 Transcript_20183/m.2711 type:complete len:88 (-) Transcript_20183:190-453(-)